MAQNKPGKIQDLNGMFIYHDPKHGTIYYDIFTKRAFNLTTSDLQTCLFYEATLPVAILVAFALVAFFSVSVAMAFGIAAVAYIISEILFRVMYFYKLPEVDNWKPIQKEKFVIRFAKEYSVKRLVALAIMLLALAFCIVAYEWMEQVPTYSLITGYVLAAASILFAIICVVAIIVKKKNNY